MSNNLNKIKRKLIELQSQTDTIEYFIPDYWIEQNFAKGELIPVNAAQFFYNKIIEIEFLSKSVKKNKRARIYNSFTRLNTHIEQNKLQNKFYQPLAFSDNGTFLKTIALLPYLVSLGITHLYLLPITEIGSKGQKGNLGSPYSIKNHYNLDPNLKDTLLNFEDDTEFAALVEAAHLLGIKVIVEMVFRTASKDNTLIPIHPDWFYWIKESGRANFTLPQFSELELQEIKQKVENKDFIDLIPPNIDYISQFSETPIRMIKENGEYIGINANGERCVIPGAFADWPPDDTQPTWDDVTYLKLHYHHNYNYIAYNTVRMYEQELINGKYDNKELIEYLTGIIPYFIDKFDIDGIMLDMGHSLPTKLLENIIHQAKKEKADFIFYEENFVVTDNSIENGFEAVAGYLPFDLHNLQRTKDLANHLINNKLQIKYFGTSETHNTPRAFQRFNNANYSKMSYLLCNLLPNSIPFILNGFELLESTPINTGLDFTDELKSGYSPDNLPLFSKSQLNWKNSETIISFIQEINKIIDSYSQISFNKVIENDDCLIIDIVVDDIEYFFISNYQENLVQISLDILQIEQEKILYSIDCSLEQRILILYNQFSTCIIAK